MNNPKLTNIFLIALIAINGLLLIGMIVNTHRRNGHRFAMHSPFNGRHRDEFAFRSHFGGGFHNHHRRNFGGEEHRNYNNFNGFDNR